MQDLAHVFSPVESGMSPVFVFARGGEFSTSRSYLNTTFGPDCFMRSAQRVRVPAERVWINIPDLRDLSGELN